MQKKKLLYFDAENRGTQHAPLCVRASVHQARARPPGTRPGYLITNFCPYAIDSFLIFIAMLRRRVRSYDADLAAAAYLLRRLVNMYFLF